MRASATSYRKIDRNVSDLHAPAHRSTARPVRGLRTRMVALLAAERKRMRLATVALRSSME